MGAQWPYWRFSTRATAPPQKSLCTYVCPLPGRPCHSHHVIHRLLVKPYVSEYTTRAVQPDAVLNA